MFSASSESFGKIVDNQQFTRESVLVSYVNKILRELVAARSVYYLQSPKENSKTTFFFEKPESLEPKGLRLSLVKCFVYPRNRWKYFKK